MARASDGFSAPGYYSLRRLTQFPVTLISSRTTNLRNIRAVSISDSSTNQQPSLEVIGGAVDSSLPDVKFRRQCFRTRDYGTVSLDWISGDDRSLSYDSPVLILLFYSASFLGNITEVVEYVGNRYPKANLYAAGWSLGANILVRYVGQESKLLEQALRSSPTEDMKVKAET